MIGSWTLPVFSLSNAMPNSVESNDLAIETEVTIDSVTVGERAGSFLGAPAVVSPMRKFELDDHNMPYLPQKRWLNRVHYGWINTEKSLLPSRQPDSTSFRGEWPMLLECASPAFDVRRLEELAGSADWSRLLVLAEEHGVLGHLAKCLRQLDENVVPAEIRQTLLERHRVQVFSTMRMTAELFRLLELFAAKDIPALVVKGPVLSMQAYGDPTMRSYGDLDLLVRQCDIRRATESLQATGYQAAVPLSAIDTGKIPGQYLFSKPDAKLMVELHNEFTLRYFPRRLPLEDFFKRRILVRLDTHESPALAVEEELVFICIHGTKHLWERLLWIADVAALVTRQSGIDWQKAKETAKKVGAERMVHTGLRLAVDVLHARLPDAVLAAVQADVGARKLAACVRTWLAAAGNASPSIVARAAFRLRMRGSGIFAPAYLLRLSLSPTEEDWKRGAEEARPGLLDALRRPFRLARKYGRGSKS